MLILLPTAVFRLPEPVNTNRPSLVRGSLSGLGSWIQNPRLEPVERIAVTIAVTVTCWIADLRLVPWIAWIVVGAADAGVAIKAVAARTVADSRLTAAVGRVLVEMPMGGPSGARRPGLRPGDVTITPIDGWRYP